ncbi:glycoside hydrolase family 36 protein [Coraliomargarita algicola]|uniref:Glycoside hydrolase family 36 protein n=1 Tax=Coraliomargarita algicola TaxID=3092156 RepID=A0ABZ0RPX7_9BACT|nr:glycoside hydrolase family 36 protein [Coraliomargarita sp. J2-16]WPJ96952.1 glycoside hydrolase family 36 protein [Coraliomargarita sp. J2-16]
MISSQILNGLQVDRVTTQSGKTELHLCPTALANKRITQRTAITARPECKKVTPTTSVPDSMVQLKLEDDTGSGGFIAGMTMQNSSSINHLKLAEAPAGEESKMITIFQDERHQLQIEQHLEATAVDGTLRTWTTITNNGDQAVSLEFITSFVLSGITPFSHDDAPGRLKVHRFRSWWSNEGRLYSESLEDLHLERSWGGFNIVSERFGQVGTMPVRKFFPFIAIEDSATGVFWGAQLAHAGSWQMEVTRRGDNVSISGGLADYEFGHWKKALAPGETLTTPVAHLACVQGELSDLTGKLVKLQESQLQNLPESEESLPVMFNEWCTNWGSPSHEKTMALAKRLLGTGIRYLVIDDGWAKRPPEATMQSNGDWQVDTEKFPQGIGAVCKELRELGYIPGIWFEFEVCNPGSEAWKQSEHHLHRNGKPLQVGSRRFWNLNDPWVQDYLGEKLIHFLNDNQLGYLKVDYNDTIGLGCDHPDSLGEGLRQQVNGIHSTFKRIRESVTDLVIENCSSGGHRLEPSMIGLTSMSSFSDAHESWNIPIIARQLHYLMPPRQSQIWAVLYPDDSEERFYYSLTSTLYGRMCLSGPVHDLSDQQMAIVKDAVSFYQQAASIIKNGHSRFFGPGAHNWNHPTAWQGLWRESDDGSEALLLIHTFAGLASEELVIELPNSDCRHLSRSLIDSTTPAPQLNGHTLTLPKGADFRGYAFLLKKTR